MTLRLNGSTSGYVEIDAPATAGSNTLVLPTGNGTNGQYLQTNGSGSLSWATVSTSNLTWTSTQSNTGSTITFSSIPSTARRITIVYSEVSTTSSNYIKVLLGHSSGTFITSGYNTDIHSYNSGGSQGGFSDAFGFAHFNSAPWIWNGTMYLHKAVDNTWIMTSSGHYNANDGASSYANGRLVMGANVLDAVRIDANGGSFDDGYIGFGYEV